MDSTRKCQAFDFDVTVALVHHMTGPGPTKRLDFECTGMPPYPHPCNPVGAGHALTNKRFHYRLKYLITTYYPTRTSVSLPLIHTPKRKFELSFEQVGLHLSCSTYPSKNNNKMYIKVMLTQ